MASVLQVELNELNVVASKLSALLDDHWGGTAVSTTASQPLAEGTVKRGTGSNALQSGAAPQLVRANPDANTSVYGQLANAGQLSSAHGQVQQQVTDLLAQVQSAIADLQERMKKTQQAYGDTDSDIATSTRKVRA
jgi:hypothetical protein